MGTGWPFRYRSRWPTDSSQTQASSVTTGMRMSSASAACDRERHRATVRDCLFHPPPSSRLTAPFGMWLFPSCQFPIIKNPWRPVFGVCACVCACACVWGGVLVAHAFCFAVSQHRADNCDIAYNRCT